MVNEAFAHRRLSNGGPLVSELESRIADRLGVAHCVAVCNGTVGLEIVMRGLGLEGEVIVPSFTFVATPHAVRWLGLRPVFADADPLTHNLDPAAVEAAIAPSTAAILGVHVWGRAAAIDELQRIADQHSIPLIFDAAHAFLCSHGGTSIGNFGAAEVFSFHATKFFNTFEGGAICTNDDALAERFRRLRNFGFDDSGLMADIGTNGKLSEVCGAMGLANLEVIDSVVEKNRRNFLAYREALNASGLLSLIDYDEQESNNYQYIVAELDSDCGMTVEQLSQALDAEGIRCRRYFWPGCHEAAPYADTDASHLVNTQALTERVLVLPTGDAVDPDDIAVIGQILAQLERTE